MPEKDLHKVVTILAADLVGSSNFNGMKKDVLFSIYYNRIELLFKEGRYQDKRLKSETAGDGLHIIFSDAAAAGHYALDLVEFVENYDWQAKGIQPNPGIRIALHTGIVYCHRNPVTNTFDYSGHAHDLVSRMEQVTARNEVFASENFAAVCSLQESDIYFLPVGERSLAKSAGEIKKMPFFRLCRQKKHIYTTEWEELSGATAAQFGTDADWSWLISQLSANRVIPVIGPELLRIKLVENGQSREVNLYDYAVKKLAEELNVFYSENMSFYEIFDLCRKQSHNQMEIRFKEIIEELTRSCDPPEALVTLVSMKCFPGFIATTPDSFLKKTLLQVLGKNNDWRDDWELFAGEKEFKGRDWTDIAAANLLSVEYPFIYHIFGMLNSHSVFYAISENDMLMFARAWNYSTGPENLKKYLQGREEDERKVILLLGCNYENWYARLFLFNLSAAPTCSTLCKDCGIVADNVSRNDSALSMFLARDSYGKVFFKGNAEDFVRILAAKFNQKKSNIIQRKHVSGVIVIAASREDTDKANALCDQLKSVQFNTKLIRESEAQNPLRLSMIFANAAVFIPIISPDGGNLDNLLKTGYEECCRRRTAAGKDYFMMPLFSADADSSALNFDIAPENCLHLSDAEKTLTAGALDRIYANLCVYDER